MIRRFLVGLALAAILASSSAAQVPDPNKPVTMTVTVAEFSKVWDALGEMKAKDVFGIMVKLNAQIIQQLSTPAPVPPAPPPPPVVDPEPAK